MRVWMLGVLVAAGCSGPGVDGSSSSSSSSGAAASGKVDVIGEPCGEPFTRSGGIYGQTVYVQLRNGTPDNGVRAHLLMDSPEMDLRLIGFDTVLETPNATGRVAIDWPFDLNQNQPDSRCLDLFLEWRGAHGGWQIENGVLTQCVRYPLPACGAVP
jgi:hypothetical protein